MAPVAFADLGSKAKGERARLAPCDAIQAARPATARDQASDLRLPSLLCRCPDREGHGVSYVGATVLASSWLPLPACSAGRLCGACDLHILRRPAQTASLSALQAAYQYNQVVSVAAKNSDGVVSPGLAAH